MSLLEQLAKLKKGENQHDGEKVVNQTRRGDRPQVPRPVETDADPDQPDDGTFAGGLFPDVEDDSAPAAELSMAHDGTAGEKTRIMSMKHGPDVTKKKKRRK